MNERGQLGEDFSAKFLENNGYNIIERNYHSRYGEIDIIATKSDILAFVEVKYRASNAMVTGLEAVNASKQKKIIKTAFKFLENNKLNQFQPRFDVIEIIAQKNGLYAVEHVENAFIYKPEDGGFVF